MLNEKDLISINKRFDNGNVVNQGSLKYTITLVKRTNSWIKQLAHLIRAILIDHIFEGGNKRTTVAVIYYYLDENGYNYKIEDVNTLIIRVLKYNITKINQIERLIENVIK